MQQKTTSAVPPNFEGEPERLTRPEAIGRLREKLKTLAGSGECMCDVVGRLGVFCRGFARLPDREFRQQFDWIAKKRPGATREALEEIASAYHQARQEATGAVICCDLETREHVGCDGWNAFDNSRLEEVVRALLGQNVRIG